MTNSKGRE